jgi:hypothetical protein
MTARARKTSKPTRPADGHHREPQDERLDGPQRTDGEQAPEQLNSDLHHLAKPPPRAHSSGELAYLPKHITKVG